MSNIPEPDAHGRYRVRRKGDPQSPAWSTRIYDPEEHVIVPGPASDVYGAALPEKPHRLLEQPATPTNTDKKEK